MPPAASDPGPLRAAELARVLPMYALPHHALGSLMRLATRLRWAPWKNRQIRWFVRRYGVDLSVAEHARPEDYLDFNSFFTRALRGGARPLCTGATLACPADGTLSEAGTVDGDSVLQAKGMHYSLTGLLGGDAVRARPFLGGHFATVYLSPRDYHRVHMPLSGTLREMIHVRGRLFSVNAASVRAVPRLFVRNERVVSIFDTEHGPLAVVLVGAVFVGSIDQAWCGTVTPRRRDAPPVIRYPAAGEDGSISLEKGAEMGRFNMGSTVVVVLGSDALRWCDDARAGAGVRVGQSLATLGPGAP